MPCRWRFGGLTPWEYVPPDEQQQYQRDGEDDQGLKYPTPRRLGVPRGMHNLSMPQALDLWSDLEAAYYGKSRFGGDTAEIYIYRLMPFSPSVVALWDKPGALDGSTMTAQWARGEYDLANEALHDLLRHFAKKKDVRIEVEGQELGPWLKTARHTHRVHVRVISEKPR